MKIPMSAKQAARVLVEKWPRSMLVDLIAELQKRLDGSVVKFPRPA
jgi:hypothetical protein